MLPAMCVAYINRQQQMGQEHKDRANTKGVIAKQKDRSEGRRHRQPDKGMSKAEEMKNKGAKMKGKGQARYKDTARKMKEDGKGKKRQLPFFV